MRLARADALDAMIDGADSGREPQPFRRVHAEPGIEDHRARHQQRMAQRFLDLGLLVGDAGRGGELAAGNRRRHADLAHRRRGELRRSAATGPDPVDVVGIADVVGEAKLHRLGAVGDRTAADRDDEIGIRGAGLFAGGDDRGARRMRRHRVEGAGAARAQRAADGFDHVGFAVERAADHQEGACGCRAGSTARRAPRMPAVRTRPHPSRRIRHALYARLVLPGHFGCLPALAARLAEEIRDVMSEDDAVVPVGWVE